MIEIPPPNQEIRFLRDLEVGDLDTLDLASLARALFHGLHLADLPFRIALFGPWGSGKSTVLRRVQQLLEHQPGALPAQAPAADAIQSPTADEAQAPTADETPRPDDPKQTGARPRATPLVRTLWFNPWEYEFDSSPLYRLAVSMSEMIPEELRYSRDGARIIRDVEETIRRMGRRGQDARGADVEPRLPPPQSAEDAHDRLGTLRDDMASFVDLILGDVTDHPDARLIIFIDDLDKCPPANVINFLEGSKLFFAAGARVAMVCALDAEVLHNAVALKYSRRGRFDTDRYVEKIFDFSYEVPPIQSSHLSTLIHGLYRRANLGDRLEPRARDAQLEAIERALNRPGLILNPRRLKRIYNKFIWLLAARDWLPAFSQHELDMWLSWLLVSEYWRPFRRLVALHGPEVLGELCNRVTGNLLFAHANDPARQAIETLPDARPLLDYFRHLFNRTGDIHTAETQQRLRTMIDGFYQIDQILRAHGM